MSKNVKAKVYHCDLYGKREDKYDFLNNNSIGSIDWQEIVNKEPYFFFVPKNFDEENSYNQGFSVDDIFYLMGTGILTSRDEFAISDDLKLLKIHVEDFCNENLSLSDFQAKYNLSDNYQWKLSEQRKQVRSYDERLIKKISYRLFDNRFIYYHDNVVFRTRKNTQHNLFEENNNLALVLCRQIASNDWRHLFVSSFMTDDSLVSNKTKERGYCIPLYIYSENNGQQNTELTTERTPNLNPDIVKQIAEKLGLSFTPESFDCAQDSNVSTFAPIDILDYIYAVLHSPNYREKYKEFLKIDFPRVPYPENKETFWRLVQLGGELRQLHLLESQKVNQYITTYPQDGTNEVGKVWFEAAKRAPSDSPGGGEPADALDEGYNDDDDNKVMEPGWNTANPEYYRVLKEDKARLKAEMTAAERVLWQELRGKRLGVRFRRQHIVDCFIPDFVCLWYKLIIEVDGRIHDFQKEYDDRRTARLNELGYEVIRFRNEEVLTNIDEVLEKIKTALKQREPIAIAVQESSGHPTSSLLRRAGQAEEKNTKGEPWVAGEENPNAMAGKTAQKGKVWINETQYFAGVPQVAWEFYIGGYQPAQKWLKDRKGRTLSFEDILHYQKVIVALTETARVMGEIDNM